MHSSRRRVLHIINTARIGGGMRHLLGLLRRMDSSRYETYLATSGDDRLIDLAEQAGAEVISLPMMHMRPNVVPIVKLTRLIREKGIDLVHMHGTRAGFYGGIACKLAGVKNSIYTVHGFSFNKEMNPLGKITYRQVERLLSRINRRLISVSETDRLAALDMRICEPGRIRTIYNGIDLEAFNPAQGNGVVRHSLKIPDRTKVVGVINRLVPQKGVEFFLEAAKEVAGRRDDVAFLVVGEGELLEPLRDMAEDLGLGNKVVFTGATHQVADYYRSLDCFVLASLWEGQPYALIEALAMGCPTVATRTSGSPEVLEDGTTGLLVPPKDARALADAILWVLDHPEKAVEMARRGRRIVEERFTEDRMVAQTIEVYEDLFRDNA